MERDTPGVRLNLSPVNYVRWVQKGDISSAGRRTSRHAPIGRHLISDGRPRTGVLASVEGRTGQAGPEAVRAAYRQVERKLAAHGLRVSWPVSIEIVRMPILGATKTSNGRHTLFASLDALRSGALDGLKARGTGHMIRTETRHPSHDPAVLQRMGKAVQVPRAGLQAIGEASTPRRTSERTIWRSSRVSRTEPHGFFRVWVEGNSSVRSEDRGRNVSRCVTDGFALGTDAASASSQTTIRSCLGPATSTDEQTLRRSTGPRNSSSSSPRRPPQGRSWRA